jgi:hypothetical protein
LASEKSGALAKAANVLRIADVAWCAHVRMLLALAFLKDLVISKEINQYLTLNLEQSLLATIEGRILLQFFSVIDESNVSARSEFASHALKDFIKNPNMLHCKLELSRLAGCIDSRYLLKLAYANNPTCVDLSSRLASVHGPFGFMNLARRQEVHERLSAASSSWCTDVLIFTPLIQISIGHYALAIDTLYAYRALDYTPKQVYFYLHPDCGGLELVDNLRHLTDARLNVFHPSSILKSRVSDLKATHMLTDGYYYSFMPVKVKNHITFGARQVSCRSQIVVLHLRTDLYKMDQASPHARIRSVNPESYVELIDKLKGFGFIPVLVSADNGDYSCLKCEVIRCDSSSAISKQWKALKECAFMIGTCSGISNLSCLGSGSLFLTNNTNLWQPGQLSQYHLICCKRFAVSPFVSINEFTLFERFARVADLWEADDGLHTYADVRDLSSAELVECFLQFHGWRNNNVRPPSLYDVLSQVGMGSQCYLFQDRFLSTSTYLDLINFLKA